tara:strand:- start:2709 stop:3716 length:1008 start_codon:yes stop_codon:yes gene_type:complete
MKRSIYFRVDGDDGTKIGLGHAYRCLKIYDSLKKIYKRNLNYYFLMKNYQIGKKLIKSSTGEKIINLDKIKISNIKFNKSDVLIIDTLGVEKQLLNYAHKRNLNKIISFEETNTKLFKRGIIINGIYFAKKTLKKTKNVKIFQGTKYIVLDKAFSTKKRNLHDSKNLKIIVSSGGGDKKNFLYKISLALKKIPNILIYIIIGKGVEKKNPIFKLKKFKKFKFISYKKNIFRYFQNSHLAFVSGGTVMFESICSGKKTFVCKTYENQKYAIKYFKNKKLISYLGDINSLKEGKVLNKFKNTNYLRETGTYWFKKRIYEIDGKGLIRIKKILKNLIN